MASLSLRSQQADPMDDAMDLDLDFEEEEEPSHKPTVRELLMASDSDDDDMDQPSQLPSSPTKPIVLENQKPPPRPKVVHQDPTNEDYVFDKLNDYFRLQTAYEAPYRKIVGSTALSLREKKKKLKAFQPLCINCKQVGGTTFEVRAAATKKGDTMREYRAVCANKVRPCGLDISIRLCDNELLPDLLTSVQNEINQTKLRIIAHKNSGLFGLDTPSETFDQLKKQLEEWTDIYELCLQRYDELYHNPQQQAERDQLVRQIHAFKEEIADYQHRLQDESLLDATTLANHAMVTYEQLREACTRLRRLQYGESRVVQQGDDTFVLQQEKVSLAQSEYFSCEHKVASYHTGTKRMDTPAAKKLKPLSAEEQAQPLATQSQHQLGGGGSKSEPAVQWDTPEEKRIWDQLSPTTQDWLVRNPIWMQELVRQCVADVKAHRTCRLERPPTELIVPPFLEDDGLYDFGVAAYNQVLREHPLLLQTHKQAKTGLIDFDRMVQEITKYLDKHVLEDLHHLH